MQAPEAWQSMLPPTWDVVVFALGPCVCRDLKKWGPKVPTKEFGKKNFCQRHTVYHVWSTVSSLGYLFNIKLGTVQCRAAKIKGKKNNKTRIISSLRRLLRRNCTELKDSRIWLLLFRTGSLSIVSIDITSIYLFSSNCGFGTLAVAALPQNSCGENRRNSLWCCSNQSW